jgi:hypothetical protein
VIGRWEAALGNAPASLMTSAAGLIVAIPLSTAVRGALEKAGLLNQGDN